MSKKRKIMVGIMVVIVVVVASCFALWGLNKQLESPSPTYRVEYTLEETSDGWYINITNTIREHGSIIGVYEFKEDIVKYLLHDTTGNLVDPLPPATGEKWKTIADINGTPSPRYNVTWNDIDSDGMLSIGDNFFISKTGGTDGVAQSGYHISIYYSGCELAKVVLWIRK